MWNDNHTDLKVFEEEANLAKVGGIWLREDEVELAIASVTFALSKAQSIEKGFGFVPNIVVQTFQQEVTELNRTIRPGRPMLVYIHLEQHFVLLIISLNADLKPTLTVMDSKSYYLDAAARQEVHDKALLILRHSQWCHSTWTQDAVEDMLPSETIWAPSAQQPTDAECGYYVVLNAWTLVLGLQPDPNFDPHSGPNSAKEFWSQARALMKLARMGKVSSKLIYAFLKCTRFAAEGHVALDRAFEATCQMRDAITDLTEASYEIQDLENVAFSEHDASNGTLFDARTLHEANGLLFPPGRRRHNDPSAFPSDEWTFDVRMVIVPELIERKQLDPLRNLDQI